MGLFEKKRSERDEIVEQLSELAIKLSKVREQVRELNSQVQRLEPSVKEYKAQSEELESYAKKALAAGNPDDARVFLTEKNTVDNKLKAVREQYDSVKETRDQAVELHDKIVRELNSAKNRLALLDARESVAQAQLAAGSPGDHSDLDRAFEKLEAQADAEEAAADAQSYTSEDNNGF
ncbi:MAG: PspA/IM30 family protein [Ruminococcus sp.]|nr:PspA/IM30 family protein [Ruminococcus sp.]